MRSLLPSIVAVVAVGCFGPSEAQQALVPELESAAEASILAEGAATAEARDVAVSDVVWLLGEHTVVVDSTWPVGSKEAKANIPVVVRFDGKEDGSWVIEEVRPDAAGLRRLRKELGVAEVKAAEVRKQQAVVDGRIVQAHAALTRRAEGGGLDHVLPGIKHLDIGNCVATAVIDSAWTSGSKKRRRSQLAALGSTWAGILDDHQVRCADPTVRLVVAGSSLTSAPVGEWRRSRGVLTP